MVKKILGSANEVGDEIQEKKFHKIYRVQHSIALITFKKLSHEKHLFYKRIKNFKLKCDMSNLQKF